VNLYHFSEDPDIEEFVPRAPVARPEIEPLVWAVDADHAWTYLFPRDCPRVLLWKALDTTDSDWQRWAGANETAKVACVEWRWFEQLRRQRLFRYTFRPTWFKPIEGDPWMYVSAEAVQPTAVDEIPDLIGALADEGVELRLMPSLSPLRGAWESTVHFSGIRLRNAMGWE
jgi:hypothetical protein